jgi:signal transduction histidine kinase
MPNDLPAQPETGPEGLNFATALSDCLLCGVVVLDSANRVSTCTAEARAILGLADDARPIALADLPAAVCSLVEQVRASAAPAASRPLEVGPAERPRRIWGSAIPAAANGAPASVTVVLNEVQDSSELAARLQRLDRLANLGTLTSTIAHEMKNALVAGKTLVDVVLEKHPDADLAEIVRREFRRLDTLILQMLRSAGTDQAAFARVPIHPALDHALRLVEHSAKIKAVAIERAYAAGADVVIGNQIQLEQAFLNLFLNALDAMGHGGRLGIATEVLTAPGSSARLRIVVSDSGPGFPPEVLGRIFEPFFTTKEGGTGLGLAIARRIIVGHGGQITAANRPGGGSEFLIELPTV